MDTFVKVIHNYNYSNHGNEYSMKEGEIFLLLKKANEDWWQVICIFWLIFPNINFVRINNIDLVVLDVTSFEFFNIDIFL